MTIEESCIIIGWSLKCTSTPTFQGPSIKIILKNLTLKYQLPKLSHPGITEEEYNHIAFLFLALKLSFFFIKYENISFL